MIKRFLWIYITGSILVNHLYLKDQYFRSSLPFIQSFRYSDFLVQKWFLTLVAISIFIGWLLSKKKIIWNALSKYKLYLLIIILVTLVAHGFGFERWFEFDDYRLIGHHFAVSGTVNYNSMGAVNNPYYGYAFAYLVVRWFNDSFVLYNGTGTLILILIGFVIFFFSNVIQKNKWISLLIALVFTTSTTYFRQIIQMHEFLGDTFPLLLFTIAIYFSVKNFWPGAIIFATAAMEFGLSREHFIGVPLFLLVLFFASQKLSRIKKITLALVFPLITFFYLPVFLNFPPQIINRSDWLSNWPQGVRLLDVIFGTTAPHLLAYFVFSFPNFILHNFYYSDEGILAYFSPILGFVFVSTMLVLIVIKRKNYLAMKLLTVGMTIIVGSVIFQTLSGIRLEHNLSALHRQYLDLLPSAPTSYGLPAAVGISILFLGFSQIMKKRIFYTFAMAIIFTNSIGFLVADLEWIKRFSYPQMKANSQLSKIIPYNGLVKIVYTPHPSEILSRYVSYFYQLYRIKDQVYETNDPRELVKLVDKYKPEANNVFFLIIDRGSLKISDKSELLRLGYPVNINLKYLESLPPQ